MKKAIVISLVAILLNSACVFAQTPYAENQKEFTSAYDSYIRRTMEKIPDIPGFAIVVVRDDKPIFVRGYGMANKEAGTKADADTLFYIASSTKSFTALAAALLDKEGKIKLSDPVTKYAAGINLKNPLPEKITIRDLLTHTSALKNEALTFRMAYSGDVDTKDMARVFGEATAYSDIDYGKYRYDNLGYNIYGVLLQNHLKKKWQDLLQERIFDPMGMKHTTAYISKAASRKWTVAQPYIFSGVAGKTSLSPLGKTDNNMQSAGGIFASASDIGRWLNMNMNGGMLDGRQVIPAEIVRAAQTGYTKTTRDAPPFTGDGEYGLGWQIGKYKNEKVIYHHGGFPGYRSHISFMPDKRIAVAVLVNDGSAGGRAGHMLATYAYDWWLRTADLEADYSKQLQELYDGYERGKQQIAAAAADRSNRISQLSLPAADYAGKYSNEYFGTIDITAIGNELTLRMGNIKTIATAYTEKETIRVEITPGSGEVVKFIRDASEKIGSLSYAGVTFIRTKP